MWLSSYRYDEENNVLSVKLSESHECLKENGEITITRSLVKTYAGHLGKGAVEASNISDFELCSDGDDFMLVINKMADNEWNEMMSKKHPLKWKLGVVKKDVDAADVMLKSKQYETIKTVLDYLDCLGFNVIDNTL